jgi:hypothetical protein
MQISQIVGTIEALVVLLGVTGVIYALFKNGSTRATIASQKDLIETLSRQVETLRQLHIDNEKAISELKGQVSVYKELPLDKLANSMGEMAVAQKEILKIINKKITIK